MKRPLLLAALVMMAVAGLAHAAAELSIASLPHSLLFALRWITLALLFGYGMVRRNLTAWIVVSMFLGAEIGHDFPALATNLRVLSQVFLSLIKTIIAPLLFATLVSGIAGHADLKKVGRMGVKAIVYFEIVTTLALFIGLAAINISKAGVGVQLPAPTGETLPATKHTASE
ncbi:MAG TPA: cation:dicarboxylase symporter family transporter, partial [Terriglobales bacterium]|nr:cation:dicarboxylase symporter family transporter [Terriglobales bacterium]